MLHLNIQKKAVVFEGQSMLTAKKTQTNFYNADA